KNNVNAATIRLTGKVGSRAETFTFAGQHFPAERGDNSFLARLWATRRVGYLLEQIRLNGENKELRDEIIQLGTRYGIVTPYTSFLVTEDTKDIGRRNIPMEQRRALDSMSQGLPGSVGGIGNGSGRGRAAETVTVTGESAVVY